MASINTYANVASNKDANTLALGRVGSGPAVDTDDLVVLCISGDTGATSVDISYLDYTYKSHLPGQYEFYQGQNFYAEDLAAGYQNGLYRWAYTFTPESSVDISAFSLYIWDHYSSGSLCVSLQYADDNDLPFGDILASVTVTTTSLTKQAYNKLTFPTSCHFNAGQKFSIGWYSINDNGCTFKVESHSDQPERVFKSTTSGSTWVEQNKEPYYYLYAGRVSSGSLTKDAEIIFSTNVTVQLWSARLLSMPGSYDGGGDLVANFSGVSAHSGFAYHIKGAVTSGSVFDKVSTNSGTGTSATSGSISGMTYSPELVVGVIGQEGAGDDAAGTWNPPIDYWYGFGGTTGGGAAGNNNIHFVAEIVTSTGTYAIGETGLASRDYAAIIGTYKLAQGISITPTYVSAVARTISPFVPESATIADIFASAKTAVAGGFKNNLYLEPAAITLAISTSYPFYRRIRIGWGRFEVDTSGAYFIFPAALLAGTDAINPTIIQSSTTANLASKPASAVATVINPEFAGTFNLRRWDGAQWVDETFLVYQSGTWANKPVYMWLAGEWRLIS